MLSSAVKKTNQDMFVVGDLVSSLQCHVPQYLKLLSCNKEGFLAVSGQARGFSHYATCRLSIHSAGVSKDLPMDLTIANFKLAPAFCDRLTDLRELRKRCFEQPKN